MSVSQKCQYALRAAFELAKRRGQGATTIAEIAAVQEIPPKFLELILNELRQGGFVESRRGARGGYMLSSDPSSLFAGDIIRFVDGPVAPVGCVERGANEDCPLRHQCAFMDMWRRARDAVADVYDTTSLEDLIEAERASAEAHSPSYCI